MGKFYEPAGEDVERMQRAEYEATQRVLQMVASMLLPLDLKGFLAAIGRAEALGPVLDPSLYMAASAKLDTVKALAQAAQGLQCVAAESVR